MKRWKSASNGVLRASARSTWASPRTLRRTLIPASWRSSAKAVLREEVEHRRGHRIGLLDAGQMAGARDRRPAGRSGRGWPARPPARAASSRPGRRPCTGLARRSSRAACGQIGVADGGAAGEVAFERRSGEHVAPAGELGWTVAMERCREPATEDRVGDAADPARADGIDPLAPHLGGADLVGRVHQHQPAHQVGPGRWPAPERSCRRSRGRKRARPWRHERRAAEPDPRRARPSSTGPVSRRSGRGRACRSGRSRTGPRTWAAGASQTRRSVPREFTNTSSGASAGPVCR